MVNMGFIFDGNINVCPISKHLRDIHKSNKNPESLTLKMKVSVEKKKHENFTIWLAMFDFLSMIFFEF